MNIILRKHTNRTVLHSKLHFQQVLLHTPRFIQEKMNHWYKLIRNMLSLSLSLSLSHTHTHTHTELEASILINKWTFISGFFSLRKFPATVTVPPVPIPATRTSTFPAESLHIPRKCFIMDLNKE